MRNVLIYLSAECIFLYSIVNTKHSIRYTQNKEDYLNIKSTITESMNSG